MTLLANTGVGPDKFGGHEITGDMTRYGIRIFREQWTVRNIWRITKPPFLKESFSYAFSIQNNPRNNEYAYDCNLVTLPDSVFVQCDYWPD